MLRVHYGIGTQNQHSRRSDSVRTATVRRPAARGFDVARIVPDVEPPGARFPTAAGRQRFSGSFSWRLGFRHYVRSVAELDLLTSAVRVALGIVGHYAPP